MTPQNQKTGTVTIDGRKYKTVRIGNQEWLAENLASANHSNGESWDNGEFGRLYNQDAAESIKFPAGWNLATDKDFQALKDKYGDVTGKKMKSITGWEHDGNGTNELGFDGRPGGYRNPDGNFYNRGQIGYWWCTGDGGSTGVRWGLGYSNSVLWRYLNPKTYGFSVRCVRNLTAEECAAIDNLASSAISRNEKGQFVKNQKTVVMEEKISLREKMCLTFILFGIKLFKPANSGFEIDNLEKEIKELVK